MRFDILTLFPELFTPFLESGVTRRAYASGQVGVHLWNPRDHAQGNYRRVDDRPEPPMTCRRCGHDFPWVHPDGLCGLCYAMTVEAHAGCRRFGPWHQLRL